MSFSLNIFKGKKGENLAADYLIKLGYKIIDRNWHYSRNAEIDIIAEEKGTLVFVEVKTRSSSECGHPFEAITPSKIKKLNTAIYGYLNTTGGKYSAFRLDGIAITGSENPVIEHLKNIGQY